MKNELETVMRDVERCWQALDDYKETAGQHEFFMLLMFDSKAVSAYNDLHKNPNVDHAKVFCRTMIRFLTQELGVQVGGLEMQYD